MAFSAAVVAMRPRLLAWGERGGELPTGDFDVLYAAGIVDVAAGRLSWHGWGDEPVARVVRALSPNHGAALLEWLGELVPAPRRASLPPRRRSCEVPASTALLDMAVDITKQLLLAEAVLD